MLTYGIFLFFSIFPIIHPKGLAQMPEGNMENTELLPLGVEQKNDETEHPLLTCAWEKTWYLLLWHSTGSG